MHLGSTSSQLMIVDWRSALLGGLLLSLSISLHLALTGRFTALSGVFNGMMEPKGRNYTWKRVYTSGLMFGYLVASVLLPEIATPQSFDGKVVSWAGVAIGGFLVGSGTRLGSGCTSGHSLCGIARLSTRSFVATGIFLGTAMLVATELNSTGLLREQPSVYDVPCNGVRWLATAFAVKLFLSSALIDESVSLLHDVLTFLCGYIFGFGLMLSTLARPDKLMASIVWINWETWDATVVAVFGCGIFLNFVGFKLVLSLLKEPWVSSTGWVHGLKHFELPTATKVTGRLVIGSLIFGIGLGIAGVCPGPAVGLATLGVPKYAVFVPSMLMGMRLVDVCSP